MLGTFLAAPPAFAQPWNFGVPVAVTGTAGSGVFHHLESSGRRSIGVSGNRVAVIWGDDRDGTRDIWLSWREGDGWSGDLAVPGASGSAEQSDPVLALDAHGNLHRAWAERDEINGPTQLLYRMAQPAG